MIKELDRWENESETTTVDYVDFQRDENGKVVVDEDGGPGWNAEVTENNNEKEKVSSDSF